MPTFSQQAVSIYSGEVSSRIASPSFLIEGGDVVLPDRVIKSGMVFVHEGSIRYAGSSDRPGTAGPSGALPVIDASGLLVCPALWEPHIHGCAGATTENATPESLRHMAGYLASQGVGAFVPTTVADEAYVGALGDALAAVAAERDLASRIPGIHVEGPYVNPVRRGGIPESVVRPFSAAHLERLGFAKEVDWVEFEARPPAGGIPERMRKLGEFALKRGKFSRYYIES